MTDNDSPPGGNNHTPVFVKKLIAGLLLVNIIVYSLAALSLYQIWLQHEGRVITSTQNISRILSNSIADVIGKADFVLLGIEDEFQRQYAAEGINKDVLDTYIARQARRTPELESLVIADQDGDILYGDFSQPQVPVNVTDREYFQTVRDSSSRHFVISRPLISRISGRWVIPLVRRLHYPDGTFAGAVLGVFPLEFFTNLFASVDTGKNGTIALRDLDLVGVARYPEPKGVGSTIGQKSTMAELIDSIRAGNQAGIIKGRASVDNVRRIYSYQRVPNLPFYILVGQSLETYLKTFARVAVAQMAFVVLFTLSSLLLARQLNLKWRQDQMIKKDLERQVKERTSELADANRRLLALSTTDGLTGIANRRKFDTTWIEEWRRACRMGHSLAILMIDVDFFKAFNDHYGHQAGDVCLQRLAHILTTSVNRAGELVARYGGEEFVVILPGLSYREASETAERIRATVEAEAIPHAMRTDGAVVTVSIGIAVHHPRQGETSDSLLKEADASLYRAKEEGRNRVCPAGADLTPPP